MNYTILLWPHANARYRIESARLALAELEMLLRRIAPDAKAAVGESAELPTLEIQCASPLSDADVAALRGLSLLYALFERRGDALIPLAGREQAYLGEDLPGILKYKGKTNELFTQLLVNVALYCGDYLASPEPIRLLDPMCGRGTTLFVGANRGWQCTGTDVDKADLKEAETFFKRYLEYHRFKHALERESFTLKGKKSAPGAAFTFADTPEHFRQKQTASLKLTNCDATEAREAFGSRAFHLIACDLPYGVQHASQGSSLEKLLARALPGWRGMLKPGGTVAVSFNAQTLKPARVHELMAEAGLSPVEETADGRFAHWVEQAVTRDLAVARRG